MKKNWFAVAIQVIGFTAYLCGVVAGKSWAPFQWSETVRFVIAGTAGGLIGFLTLLFVMSSAPPPGQKSN